MQPARNCSSFSSLIRGRNTMGFTVLKWHRFSLCLWDVMLIWPFVFHKISHDLIIFVKVWRNSIGSLCFEQKGNLVEGAEREFVSCLDSWLHCVRNYDPLIIFNQLGQCFLYFWGDGPVIILGPSTLHFHSAYTLSVFCWRQYSFYHLGVIGWTERAWLASEP